MTDHRFERRTTPDVIRDAAGWFIRLRGPDGRRARADYARWLLAAPERSQACEEIEDVWGLAGELANDPEIRDLIARTPSDVGPTASERGGWNRRALAAALVGAIALAGIGTVLKLHAVPGAVEEVYATDLGEQRNVTLSDGSVIHLDTASEVAVKMTSGQRNVRLRDGRARFNVAHDSDRPFIVQAGQARVQALGTVFDVSRAADGVGVDLFQGGVEVRREGQSSVQPVRLSPGDHVQVSASAAPLRVVRFDPASRWSWTSGRLLFNGAPLTQVAAEVNRYETRKLIISDASAQKFRGELKAGDLEGSAAILAALYGLSVSRTPNGDLLLGPPR